MALNHTSPTEVTAPIAEATIVLIDNRALVRDCLAQCLRASNPHYLVLEFASVEHWLYGIEDRPGASLVVLAGGNRPVEGTLERDLSRLAKWEGRIPVVVISDLEDRDCVMGVLQRGAKGYIPTSLGLKVALSAIQLVEVGGTFVPANTVMASRILLDCVHEDARAKQSRAALSNFTRRQLAVVNALRQGKANKIIAHELNMCESTVKVHVRNIMKKLKAKNRTEVAFMCNSSIPPANAVMNAPSNV